MYSVAQLVRKDFILSYRYLLILIPVMIFMTWVQAGSLLVYVTLPSIFMLIASCTFDRQNGTPRLTASLPVTRAQIVLSKYASLIPFTLLGILCAFVLQMMANLIAPASITFGRLEGAAVIMINVALASLYLPLYFWLGPKGMQIVRLVFIMIVATGSGAIGTWVKESPDLQRWTNGDFAPDTALIAGSAAGVIVLLVVSMFASFQLYQRQEIQ
ncbi:hypothetical protein B9G55_06645 [Saccharibacillus sp. O16]|nr:hypothetical protein B9G55_06645 [Saccharibacillus sp. O16]